MRLKFCILLLLFCNAGALAQEEWPRLDDRGLYNDTPRCRLALSIASSLFYSNNIYEEQDVTPQIPEGFNSKLILEVKKSYGRYEIIDHFHIFKKFPENPEEGKYIDLTTKGINYIYWQIKPTNKVRLVLIIDKFGADNMPWYELYKIPEEMTMEELIALSKSTSNKFRHDGEITSGPHAPLIFQDNDSDELWAIDTNWTFGFWNAWQVFSSGDKDDRTCFVEFCEIGTRRQDLLPNEVNKFAELLYTTLSSRGSFSLYHAYGEIRDQVQNRWVNIALRPWVLNEEVPYERQSAIDSHLDTWISKSHFNKQQYKKILKQYEEAEEALTEYYIEKFDTTPEEAHIMASYALSLVFREYALFLTHSM
jgi:hypothetical protein